MYQYSPWKTVPVKRGLVKATYRPAIAEGVPESTPGITKMALEQLLGYEPSSFWALVVMSPSARYRS
jgi:hypothetical protein